MIQAAEPSIPLADLAEEVREQWDDLSKAVLDVLRSGCFVLGPNVKGLEQEAAAYLGVKRCVGVASGTDALIIALRALGIGPGDEVIPTPFTFIATAEAVSRVGATPVFVDIEPDSFNIDPDRIEAALTPRTKAIVPVHLFGLACAIDAVLEIAARHGLKVLEDAAQAFGGTSKGRKLGSIGAAGAFSFFPSKNLGGWGDGGLISTNDDGVADAALVLRDHGSRRRYYHEVFGYNSRLDEVQAAFLRVKLPLIDRRNQARREAAARYDRLIAERAGGRIVAPPCPDPADHVYHQYTVRIPGGRRDQVRRRLSEAGIETAIYYPVPIHRQVIYDLPAGTCPNAEAAAAEVLSLPMWPGITAEQQERVVAVMCEAL